MRPVQVTRSVALLFVALVAAPSAQSSGDPDAVRLRTLYFQRAYGMGVQEGEKIATSPTDRLEAQAWYLACLARNGKTDEAGAAIELADRKAHLQLAERIARDAPSACSPSQKIL